MLVFAFMVVTALDFLLGEKEFCLTPIINPTLCEGGDRSFQEAYYWSVAFGTPDTDLCRSVKGKLQTATAEQKKSYGCEFPQLETWPKVPCKKFGLTNYQVCRGCDRSLSPEENIHAFVAIDKSCHRAVSGYTGNYPIGQLPVDYPELFQQAQAEAR